MEFVTSQTLEKIFVYANLAGKEILANFAFLIGSVQIKKGTLVRYLMNVDVKMVR